MPGVSMKTIWPSGCVTMPWMRLRVVCGFEVTMAIFWPTSRLRRVDLPAFGRQVMRLDTRLRANNDEALDEVAQFAHIARPRIARKNFESVVAEFAGLLAVFGAEFIEKVATKNWNVRDAVTQRRNKKGNYVQAIEKILAKRAARDFLVEVLVGGGDDANVHAN